MASSQSTDPRPLSPHISVWRWHATMAASIAHRVSGVALYVGSALIAAWVIAAAMGPEAYEAVMGLMLSLLGRIILLGFTAALMYHLANGVRHLIWDGPGVGFSPGVASAVSLFNFLFAILATLGVWSFAYFA